MGGTKLERFLPKNQLIQIMNFDNWTNGEPHVNSKIFLFGCVDF